MRTESRKTFQRAAWAAGLVLIACFSLPAAEKPENIPNPLAASGLFVGDNAGILGSEYAALIDSICRRLKEATTVELAVITVRDLGGTTVEDFADRLFRRFGIGVKGKDNGVLILCSAGDRDVRIEVGYGLEAVLTDAVSSRLLDEEAGPFLAKNEFGRGLYALTKAAAGKIAGAQNASLETADPAAWPTQPVFVPETPEASGGRAKPAAARSGTGPLILAGLAVLWGLLGAGIVFGKYNRTRGKAARGKAISGANGVTALLWTGAVGGFVALAATHSGVWSSLLSMLSPTGVTVGLGAFRRSLRRRLESYHLPCAKCGAPMDLTPEDKDDALLSVEEAAEEKAGGMDYEIWTCPACQHQERLSVKLNKARECPKCKRRTLKEVSTTLIAATTSHGGKVRVDRNCLNPNCGFTETIERATPKLSSSTTGSAGHSGSSHSSFGGGRSGGGGASRHF
ncbi:MAG: TPM domain-containing protein [Candidatus Aminicenantes bacterium]|nr:TPM domain-containing protein [Candidatus Aminicenantes bacterium]